MEGVSLTTGELRNDFLTLLTTQLTHQDPLEPTKQEEFIGQLAQFTMLERLEEMNGQMQQLVELGQQQVDHNTTSGQPTSADLMQAALLLGKTVEYTPRDANSSLSPLLASSRSPQRGEVESVTLKEGKLTLSVNGESIAMDDVRSVVSDLSASDSGSATIQ